MRNRVFRGSIALVAGLLVLAGLYFVGRPLLRRWWDAPLPIEKLPRNEVDDASRLNRTKVLNVWAVPEYPPLAESQLRDLLKFARENKINVSIAGARHSMGGHTIYPDGIVLMMSAFNRMEFFPETKTLNVGAGAKWSEIVPYLDEKGYSVAVMQSNNDFSVGGSISVNCHGWQHNQPPIASTVESFRLMKADGQIVTCSRTENQELFSLVLGGYGLFGVILDVRLRVVPNEVYRPEAEVLDAKEYVRRFREKVDGNAAVGMVYGRLCITPEEDTFFREAILTVFRRVPDEKLPPLESAGFSSLRRKVFRDQVGSVRGKKLRWAAEKALGETMFNRSFSRNQLLNESAALYQEQDPARTDILQEYFIPSSQLTVFLDAARPIILKHRADLLNVTVRNVKPDPDSFLRYADQEMFGLVMLFTHERTPDADQRIEPMTQELIDAAVACGGRYYLPYRLQATKAQFEKAYPQARPFFEKKRFYDPEQIFQNQFYLKYGAP